MRKIWLLMLALVTGQVCVRAQVQIQPTIPSVGLVQKNQLWNLVLLNGTAQPIQGMIELVIRDPRSGTDLMTAATTVFTLPKGSGQFNVNRLSPIQYNYLGIEPDKTIGGLLPVGAYLACFSFIATGKESSETLAQECIRFDVEPLNPPMLLFPTDSSVLDIQPSQFTWTPPLPASMFGRLNYDMLIAEIKPGQQPTEALQDNVSFYNSAGIANNLQTYPAAFPAFEKEKWYAWQIIARDDKNYAGHSEVWVFKVKLPETPPVHVQTAAFIQLSNTGDKSDVHRISGDQLFVKYYSFDQEHTATVRFLNTEGKAIRELKQKIIYGDNYLSFSVKQSFAFNQTYIIEITDQQNGRHTAMFSVIK